MTIEDDICQVFPARVIEERIGSGAMGSVYRAWNSDLHRREAIKVVSRQGGDRPEPGVEEARFQSRLDHPNVARVYDVRRLRSGELVIAMEFVEGFTLEQLIAEGQLSADERISIVHDLAEAIAHAHDKGVVHSDIKPANVMLTADLRVKLCDFGVARARRVHETWSQWDGPVGGTYSYMAPELFDGGIPNEASDVYSAALVMFEVMTGQAPFPEAATPLQLQRIRSDSEPARLAAVAGVPPVIAVAVDAALTPLAAGIRPTYGRDFATRLAGARGSSTVASTVLLPPDQSADTNTVSLDPSPAELRIGRRRRLLLGAAVVVGLGVATVGGFVLTRDDGDAPADASEPLPGVADPGAPPDEQEPASIATIESSGDGSPVSVAAPGASLDEVATPPPVAWAQLVGADDHVGDVRIDGQQRFDAIVLPLSIAGCGDVSASVSFPIGGGGRATGSVGIVDGAPEGTVVQVGVISGDIEIPLRLDDSNRVRTIDREMSGPDLSVTATLVRPTSTDTCVGNLIEVAAFDTVLRR